MHMSSLMVNVSWLARDPNTVQNLGFAPAQQPYTTGNQSYCRILLLMSKEEAEKASHGYQPAGHLTDSD